MKYLLLFTGLLFTGLAFGQTSADIVQYELSIRQKLDSVKYIPYDSAKIEAMHQIQKQLAIVLKNAASYSYPFDSLKSIGKVYSPDNEFRILSWNVFVFNESYLNFALIQMKPQNDECRVIPLYDNSSVDEAGNNRLHPGNWYGALYYKIIPLKSDNKTYYTLLGLDPFSPFVSKKVIDVLSFNQQETILGAPIFKVGSKYVSRKVFSYSARITMMLNYDESIQTIVFDHLSPSEPRYTGQFEFYGPDFSFDGFRLEKDHWLFVEDVKPNRPVRPKKKGKR